jgi:NTE family protein
MQYDMVFEGGGAKGIVFVGAMQEFEKRGHTHGRLLGTSAGAITACLLAAGYRSEEMLSALKEKKDGKSVFTTFLGDIAQVDRQSVQQSSIRNLLREINIKVIPDPLEEKLDDSIADMFANKPSFRHLYSFIELGGWYSADAFLTWIEGKLNSGKFNDKPRNFGSMTLEQFCTATQKDLSLVVSDTTEGVMRVLNHRTAPDCPVIWAVRMSMSIPLLWQEVKWQRNWGLYRGHTIAGNTIVDGGLLSNFPLELFLSDEKQITDLMGPKTNDNILGLLIDETLPVAGAPSPRKQTSKIDLMGLPVVQRINHLFDTLLSAHDKMVIEEFEKLVVHLPAQGYGTTEFDMSNARRQALVNAGQASMQQYFKISEKTPVKRISKSAKSQQMANRLAMRSLL